MIAREIAPSLLKMLESYPILSLTGPRQCGKTTLLRALLPDFRYVNFEDPDARLFFEQDPRGFLKQYDQKVIFDEAQRVPSLFSRLQVKTDEDRMMGQFVLSGSQNFLLLEKISQSLAGRAAVCRLLPLSHSELRAHLGGQKMPVSPDWAAFKGGYPVLYDRQTEQSVYFQSYLQTYVERDVRSALNVKDLNSFQTFLRLCAGRAGQLLNVQALSIEAGISMPTVKNWLSILEASYVIFQLPPFFENFNKRLVKSSKLYFYDTGLLCHLLGLTESRQLEQHFARGAIFENMAIVEILKNRLNRLGTSAFYFWQDSNKTEVDLVELAGLDVSLFEIKNSQTPRSEFLKGIQSFRKNAPEHRKNGKNWVIYVGDERQERSEATIESWLRLGEM